MKTIYIIIIATMSTLFVACKPVLPYQAQFVNDNAMMQGAFDIEKAESEAINYREGASGGDGGKTGGGCGCN
jgi:Domain of unknown function (DUF4266)